MRLDSVRYVLRVQQLEAELANTEGNIGQAREELAAAQGSTASLRRSSSLSERRVQQHQELVKAGRGTASTWRRSRADVEDTKAKIAGATAEEAKVRKRLGYPRGRVPGRDRRDPGPAGAGASGLSRTTVLAPADGWAINVQVRPGTMAVMVPVRPVMTFVEKEQQVYMLYTQNELSKIKPDDEAEISLNTIPGNIIKCRVLGVIWAQGQGQLTPSGELAEPHA